MANFTPQQIEEFLREFFDVVGTRQYTGARYVPIFGRKGEQSIEWDGGAAPYEPLTVVTWQGNSYTSRQFVPAGIDILNAEFWANSGNYNSQVEQYRQEVLRVQDSLDGIREDVDALDGRMDTVEERLFFSDKKAIIYSDSTFVESTQGNSVLGTLIAERTGMEIDNRGVSGTNLTHLIQYLNDADATDFEGYDFVFVAYGTNDWQGGVYLWDTYGTDRENTFQRRLNVAFDRLDSIRGDCTPVIVTPAYGHRDFDSGLANVPINTNSQGCELEAYVDIELLEARKRNYAVIDLWHTMGVNEYNYDTLLMRSSYDPQSSAYDIYVHYSETLKQRIADYFLHGYPYKIPAYPFDSSSENNVVTIGTYAGDVPITQQFDYIPLVTSFGNPDPDSSQIPYLLCNFTGDDTLSFVAKTAGYCDVQIGTASPTLRRYACRHSGYHNIRVKGIYGNQRVYIYNAEGQPQSHGDPVFNVCLQHGNTAFPYSLPLKSANRPFFDIELSNNVSGTGKMCVINGVAYITINATVTASGVGNLNIASHLPVELIDTINQYKMFIAAYHNGSTWAPRLYYLDSELSNNIRIQIGGGALAREGDMVQINLAIPITYNSLESGA